MTYHQMYRRTTLGNTLQEALDELVDHKLIQQRAAMKVLQKFDQCISIALSKRVKNRLNLKGHLKTYRFCDNVWTLVMEDVEIKDSSAIMNVDKIKIVACEGKSAKQTPASSGTGKLTSSAAADRSKPTVAAVAPEEEEEQPSAYLSADEAD